MANKVRDSIESELLIAAHPISVGNAPGIAPIIVETVQIRFNGV
jgi:hypothetical protein